jgi:hypothetical protein
MVGDAMIGVPFFPPALQVCLKMVGRPLPSDADAHEGEVRHARFPKKCLLIESWPTRPCVVTQRMYTLSPLGESRGSVFGVTVRNCCQELHQRRGRRPGWY